MKFIKLIDENSRADQETSYLINLTDVVMIKQMSAFSTDWTTEPPRSKVKSSYYEFTLRGREMFSLASSNNNLLKDILLVQEDSKEYS